MEAVCTDSDGFFLDIFRMRERARSHSEPPASLAPSFTTITAGGSFCVTSQEFSHLVWGIFPLLQIPGPSCTHWCFEVLPGNCVTHSRTWRFTALLRCFLGRGSTCKSFYADVFASTNVWEFSLIHSPIYLPPQSQSVRGCSGLWGFNHFQSRGLKSFNICPKLWLLQTNKLLYNILQDILN